MRTLVIGIGPEYNYPGEYKKWKENNTLFASNHGASLICRSIMKEFDGIYEEDLSDIQKLNANYDRCIISFATHITLRRDVSQYADVVEKLNMPVYLFSVGVKDYAQDAFGDYILHPSMKRLLSAVSEKSKFIGVRGPYSASILYRNGFKNVLPVGCPTVYSNLKPEFKVAKKVKNPKVTLVYHRTVVENNWDIVTQSKILGQDFFDEVIFTNNLDNDIFLKDFETALYTKLENGTEKLNYLKQHGVFPKDFDEWFSHIKESEFVIGPRLHGCIGALLCGVPAVMMARDLRVKEIADFFGIPNISYEMATQKSLQQIYEEADFDNFASVFSRRYDNYIAFLDLNGISHKLEKDLNKNYEYRPFLEDELVYRSIQFASLQKLQQDNKKTEKEILALKDFNWNLVNILKRVPLLRKLTNKLSK